MSAPAGQPPASLANGPEPGRLGRRLVLESTSAALFEASFVEASATSLLFAHPAAQAAERRLVALKFAQIARNIRGVEGVWLDGTLPELEVSVVMREVDFDRELELRGMFIDLICDSLDPSVGELAIYTEVEGVPPFVREGNRLS